MSDALKVISGEAAAESPAGGMAGDLSVDREERWEGRRGGVLAGSGENPRRVTQSDVGVDGVDGSKITWVGRIGACASAMFG
jgi:hypothetical protein